MQKIRYIFFYDTKTIGGAQLLFARIAESLIANGFRVLIVEQSDSFIKEFLFERKLKFEIAKVEINSKFNTEENDILVLSLSFLYYFEEYFNFHARTRLVFWDLHPFALIEALSLSYFHKKYANSYLSNLLRKLDNDLINTIQNFVVMAHNRNAIYFMSHANFRRNNDFFSLNLSKDPIYLPIPIKIDKNIKNKQVYSKINLNEKVEKKIINIGLISRIDSDKIEVIKLFLNDCFLYNQEKTIIVHIIGDGNSKGELSRFIKKLGTNLVICGYLEGYDLMNYIRENIDIAFSMGTSALEFGSQKIPIVLLPSITLISKIKKNTAKYIWLHDTFGYNLSIDLLINGKRLKSIEKIINEYLLNEDELKLDVYNYVLENHDLDKVFQDFIKYSLSSSLRYTDYLYLEMHKFAPLQKVLNNIKIRFKNIINYDKKN